MTKFIEVGFTAMRDPVTGGFLPAVPLYIEATPDAVQGEESLKTDIAKLFAARMKKYVEDGGLIEQSESTRRRAAQKS